MTRLEELQPQADACDIMFDGCTFMLFVSFCASFSALSDSVGAFGQCCSVHQIAPFQCDSKILKCIFFMFFYVFYRSCWNEIQ